MGFSVDDIYILSVIMKDRITFKLGGGGMHRGNKNFFLLWQGQLVSSFGDAIYSIALGFFVLQETGSTAIMGSIMALVTIPRIVLGPISGVIVDRWDRKRLIVLSDIICGIGIMMIALLASNNLLEIWMIIVMAMILGVCSSFFNPAVESILPDIVSKDKLIKATSSYQMATIGADIFGQSMGGVLYPLLGAPMMFLINGISYIFSSISELWINVPRVQRKKAKVTFKKDFIEGLKFILKDEGLVRLLGICFFINFLFGMIRVSMIPWFVNSSHLGMERYGILNAFQSVGLIIGMISLSVVKIKSQDKYRLYLISVFIFIIGIGLEAVLNNFILILIFAVLSFGFQFVFNTLLNSTLMLKTPMEKRGKVSSTKITIGMAISPVGNFIGGILCEFLNPRLLIILNSLLGLLIVSIIVLHPSVKKFFNDE